MNDMEEINYSFIVACDKGDLEKVREFLVEKKADIHFLNDKAFLSACFYGNLNLAEYLLTSPELKEHADLFISNNHGFSRACQNGHLNIVEFILTKTDFNKHIDYQNLLESGLKLAFDNKRMQVINYLVLEHNMVISEDTMEYLRYSEGQSVLDIINMRDLNNKLQQTLPQSSTTFKRAKL